MIILPPKPKFLCIRASAVGDVLNTLPTVSAIRSAYPESFIGYIVDERSKDLIVNHPDINQVHYFQKKHLVKLLKNPFRWKSLFSESRHFSRELREIDYDVSIDFQRNLKGGCLGLLAAAKTRLGFAPPFTMEGNHHFTHIQVKPPSDAVHFAEHFLAFARYLNAPTDKVEFKFPTSDESKTKVEHFIEKNDLHNFAIIHPGTSNFGKDKRWPPGYFAELARRLGTELNIKSIITWGPSEHDLAQSISVESHGHALMSMQTSSLLDLVELIKHAKIFIGCDSGPMHIAGAVKTPCVAIFGPKDPAIFGPYRHPSCRIVQPPGGIGPTNGVSVDNVFGAVQSII